MTAYRNAPAIPGNPLAGLTRESVALVERGVHRVAERLFAQPAAASDDTRAMFDGMKEELQAAAATLAADDASRWRHSFACMALKLHLACPHAVCRRAHVCRGNPRACYARAGAPEPVLDHVAALMLAEHVPWAPAVRDPVQRAAYAGWIAGLEAANAKRPR